MGKISHLPPHLVELVRRSLAGEQFVGEGGLEVVRSRGHGHIGVVLSVVRSMGLDRMIAPRGGRERDIVLALLAARLLFPGSKLATVRTWSDTTLLSRQEAVERALLKKHLQAGALVLYELSSSYFTGRHCPLAKRGYSRDHSGDLPQVTYGVATDAEGRPPVVEMFEGNRRDCSTLMAQVEQLRKRYKPPCVGQGRVADVVPLHATRTVRQADRRARGRG